VLLTVKDENLTYSVTSDGTQVANPAATAGGSARCATASSCRNVSAIRRRSLPHVDDVSSRAARPSCRPGAYILSRRSVVDSLELLPPTAAHGRCRAFPTRRISRPSLTPLPPAAITLAFGRTNRRSRQGPGPRACLLRQPSTATALRRAGAAARLPRVSASPRVVGLGPPAAAHSCVSRSTPASRRAAFARR
jgi:hypothetical protein